MSTKQFSIWDIVMIQIQSLYLPLMVAILGGKFIISIFVKPHLFSTDVYNVPLIYLLLAFLVVISLYLYLTKLFNYPYSSDLKYAYTKAIKLFYEKNPSIDPTRNKRRRLAASLINILYFCNIYILFFPYYLLSRSNITIALYIIVQLLQIIILIFFVYKKAGNLIQNGFKNILEEQFNSYDAQNNDHYSHFKLYTLNIITFIFWLLLFNL